MNAFRVLLLSQTDTFCAFISPNNDAVNNKKPLKHTLNFVPTEQSYNTFSNQWDTDIFAIVMESAPKEWRK